MAKTRILILEDDPVIARGYEKVLRDAGNEVTVCTSFEDARKQLRADPPDAVLTDVRVGQYNGLQLAHLFREYSATGRVVVVTGYDDIVLRHDVESLPGEFLVKPINIARLRSVFGAAA